MILTIETLRQTGRVDPHPIEAGSYLINPPLQLVCKEDGAYPHRGGLAFKKDDVVQADRFFDNVREAAYPGMVHLRDVGFNWPMDLFEIKSG